MNRMELESMTQVTEAPPTNKPASERPVRSSKRRSRVWKWFKRLLTLAFLAALAAAGAWYFQRPITEPFRVAGVVEANEVVVAATLTARLVELRVDEGDRVEAGAIVATLDRAELEATRDRH